MPDVVNNALGLAQFISSGRSEEFAVAYLQSIEGLSITDWREAKAILTTADQTNRRTKEATIADIVYTLKNESIQTNYLVRDLSLCPGLSKGALELIEYSAATLFSVRQGIEKLSSRFTEKTRDISQHQTESSVVQQSPASASIGSITTSPPLHDVNTTDFPPLNSAVYSNSSLSQPNGSWKKGKSKNQYKPAKQQQPTNKYNSVYGTGVPVNSNISHAYKFVCLGLRSGSNETVESLTTELNKWTHIKNLVVEAVRQSAHSTMFRVQYNTPASLESQWKNPAVWPSRIIASQWRGNPKLPLKSLAERLYTKRIYVGNLPSTATLTSVKENMEKYTRRKWKKVLYRKSMFSGIRQHGIGKKK